MADVTGTGLVITATAGAQGGTITSGLHLNAGASADVGTLSLGNIVLPSPNLGPVSGTLTGNAVFAQRGIADAVVVYEDLYIVSNQFGGPYGRLFWSDGINLTTGAPNAPAWEAGMTPEDGYYWSIRRLGGSSSQGTLTGTAFSVKVNDLSVEIGGSPGAPISQAPHKISAYVGENLLYLINRHPTGITAMVFNDTDGLAAGALGFGGYNNTPFTNGCNFFENQGSDGSRNGSTIHTPFLLNATYHIGGDPDAINNKWAMWRNQIVMFGDGTGIGWTGNSTLTIPNGTLIAAKVVGLADGSGSQYHAGAVIVGGTLTGSALTGGGLNAGAKVTGGFALHPPRDTSTQGFPSTAGFVANLNTGVLYYSGNGTTWRSLP